MRLASTLPDQSTKQLTGAARNPAAHETQVSEYLPLVPPKVPRPLYSKRSSNPPFQVVWSEHTNFYGHTYFYGPNQGVFTEENMHDTLLRVELGEAISYLMWCEAGGYMQRPSDAQHFLRYHQSAKQPYITGLTMSCQHGGLFMFNDDFHLGQAELYDFLQKYSMHYTRVPPFLEAQFLCAVAYGANERALMTGHANLSLTDEEWEGVMNVYNVLKGRTEGPYGSKVVPALIWHMAQTMKDVWTSRQYYCFGTIEAQTIRKPIRIAFTSAGWWSSVPRTIMGIIFFGAHSVYFERLQGVLLADGLTSAREFGGLIDHLISEWENSNLLATIFLGSNIGFLALNNLNALQRTASLASTLFSITSLITGVSYLWQHRSRSNPGSLQLIQYFNHRLLSIDPQNVRMITAYFLSVPVVMLQWSALCFLTALMAFSIQEVSELGCEFLSTLLCVLAICFIVMVLFFWMLWRTVNSQVNQ